MKSFDTLIRFGGGLGLLLASTSLLHAQSGKHTEVVDPDPDAKAAETLSKMSQEEKISLLHGPMPRLLAPSKRRPGFPVTAGWIYGVPQLDVPTLVESDASLGVSNLLNMRPGDVATSLPSGLALASSWDTDLAQRGGAMIGAETKAKGMNLLLVGGVNLARDARGGRNFEYLGEDPLLAGKLVAGQIKGVQSNGIIATIKHFALNDQETGRNVADVIMPEQAMRESDLLAFEIGIEDGRPGAIMCGYNRVNGSFACENRFLLTEVLRRDWGYKGFVMSDWGAVHSTASILVGLDQQSGLPLDRKEYLGPELVTAVKEGKVPQQVVDTAAYRVLWSIYDNNLAADPLKGIAPIDYDHNAKVAREVAERGIVLLKNKDDILPLTNRAKTIAVIGGHGDIGVLIGGGSSQVMPVGGVKLELPGGDGPSGSFVRRNWGGTAPLDGIRRAFPKATVLYADGHDLDAATKLARSSDIAIVLGEKFTSEAIDGRDLALDADGDALIEAVARANPRTVVLLEIGNPIAMPWHDQVAGIMVVWFAGQDGGSAIASVLSGQVNPSGRLPITFPSSLAQVPNPTLAGIDAAPADSQTREVYGLQAGLKPFSLIYPEGADVGYRWYDRMQYKPLFAFGEGMSYTSFRYDRLQVDRSGGLTVRFRVTNTGSRAGRDVPQVYIARRGGGKRLAGWGNVHLRPGESREVTVVSYPKVLADYDTREHRWMIPAGEVRIEVARSATTPELVQNAHLLKQILNQQ